MSAVGLESAPPDLLSWAMARLIKEKYDMLTKEATVTLYDVKWVPPKSFSRVDNRGFLY